MLANSASAECAFYIENVKVYSNHLGTGYEYCVPIKAYFSGRVSGLDLEITYPSGFNPTLIEAGEDMTVDYFDKYGIESTETPSLYGCVPPYNHVMATTNSYGYYQDESGNWVNYGVVKWEGGVHEEMFKLHFTVDENFKGGNVVFRTVCASGTDKRGGTIRENGDHAQHFDRTCYVPLVDVSSNVAALNVDFSNTADFADYAGMKLAISNPTSGQTVHYSLSDKQSYKFYGLEYNSVWDLTLTNQFGDEFGRIENVTLNQWDATVAFDTLLKSNQVNISVKTPDGVDVTEQCNVAWMDECGELLKQGNQIKGLPAGRALNYKVTLPADLAALYTVPSTNSYTVKDDYNTVICQLNAIDKVRLKGKISDAVTNLPLNEAAISATQFFGDDNTKIITTRTDNYGIYSIDALSVPTSLTATANGYVSQTVDCDMTGNGTITVPDVALSPITGTVVNVNLKYTPAHKVEQTPEVQNGYSDINNVDYEVYNKTKNRTVTDIHVQYPQIVLMEDVADGDVLEITAVSRKDAFKPVKTTVTIAEQKADATFDIVEKGQVAASFKKSGNVEVVGTLYYANGKLVDTYSYSDAVLTIKDLDDGDYTMVTMGHSRFFNTIYDLSQLPRTGLTDGVDYVKNTANVKNGIITAVEINEVPTLDESKLYYTGENTSFTVNKPSIVIGNYLTMTGHIDFKPVYAATVSNVSLIVDLPESCSFVANSVMVGDGMGNYTIDGNQITIQIPSYTDRVLFCVIPIVSGNYAPNAFVQFDMNGETIKQPIGAANFIAKDLSINVPSTVAETVIPVTGTAIGVCDIFIYDNDVLIGQTTSLANGTWGTKCELFEPSNRSIHRIYAKVTTSSGMELKTENVNCLYDENVVEVLTVTMINTADKGDCITVFDFKNPDKSIPAYRYWSKYPNFTFLIDIAYHDIGLIPFVWLHVFTSDGKVRSLRADYDEAKDRWIAADKFTLDALPTKVSVTIEDMVYDLASEATYESLIDEYVGEIHLEETVENEDGSTTTTYTDGNGDEIFSITSIESDLSVDEVVENLKQEGFEEDEYINDDSDYVPVNEYDILNPDYPAVGLANSSTGSLAIIRPSDDGRRSWIEIIRIIREEDKDTVIVKISSTITSRWKEFHKQYVKPCQVTTEYLVFTEHLDEYVTTITLSIVAYQVLNQGPLLPPIIYIDTREILAKLRRISHSYKRYTTCSKEVTVVPRNCELPPPPPPPPPFRDIEHVIDPSGFVYEGVPSNRLQGVTATCYYKETVEDMYGDLHEEVVLWDASQYGQENPLLTDENGYYRWDVPIGLWQVKYEKEGYETTYSDWLPVPPPQLDINIGMVQMRQPEVVKAHAYPQTVEFEFDKFMLPETLTTDNVTVSVNGIAVSGSIEVLNAEVDDPNAITSIRRAPGTGLTLASRFRFNADKPFNADKVTLRVNHAVESYAGLMMNEDYEAVLPVELEMTEIVADSVVVVPYLESKQLKVSVLPAAASAGKVINVVSTAPMIATTDVEQYTLDGNGEAVITVHGDLPGMTSLLYSIDGYDLTAATLIDVKRESDLTVALPTASIASGSVVEKGTAVYLFCKTEGATIYYTLDGSCPCDPSDARLTYDGTPIIINGTVTIKAMAVAEGLYDSDVATFIFRVKRLKGDVNGDGVVNISDINNLIDYILSGNVSSAAQERGDVNGDGSINISDINAIIQIILGSGSGANVPVNTADLLHVNDLSLYPGETGELRVTVDNAALYSALQCDIALPEGLTLVGVMPASGNVGVSGIVDDLTLRAVTYSLTKCPFAVGEPVLTLAVRADAAIGADSRVSLTNVVLSDAENESWYAEGCTAMVNNASGVIEQTAAADRVWTEGRTLYISTRQDGVARICTVDGKTRRMDVGAGVTSLPLEPGIYIVVLNGKSHKVLIK